MLFGNRDCYRIQCFIACVAIMGIPVIFLKRYLVLLVDRLPTMLHSIHGSHQFITFFLCYCWLLECANNGEIVRAFDSPIMIKPGFLELSSSNSSVSTEYCVNYTNNLSISNEHHHQAMINFHGIDQKPYIDKVIDNPSPSFHSNPKPENDITALFHSSGVVSSVERVGDAPDRFLNGPSTSENNVTSPSGLVTPPILSGNNDNQRALPDNVGAIIASRLKVEDRVDGCMITPEASLSPSVTNGDKHPPPEFPPQFGLPQIPPPISPKCEDLPKSPNSLHKELSTPTPIASHHRNSPEKSLDHDTPSTVSPPASLPVLPPPATSTKREPESTSPSPICDDAEYAAAARAAVDSVVCALVGNKTPCTTAAYDPALAGTGTDRLYSLSLAPVGKTDPVVVATATSTSTTVAVTSATTSAVSMCSHSPLLASAARASAEGLISLTCPACGAVVSVKQLLARQRTPGEAKHVCDTCGKSFVREDKLKRHIMSIHTMEKPHVCQICTKAFSRK